MRNRTILVAVIFMACGSPHRLHVDDELKPYLSAYLDFAPDQGHLQEMDSIRLGSPGIGHNGRCTKSIHWDTPLRTNRSVTVEPEMLESWYGAKVIFHEFGHCLHDLEHSPNPRDIMYDEIYDDEIDEEFWENHVYERISAMFYQPVD